MAAACTAMEVHDRRLSISKASASKISKPSSVLKGALSALPSSPNLSSPSPPQSSQLLPSSITSSPSRPISKVVNADPSSFRRVVQELTGTTTVPPASNGHGYSQAPQRTGLSRLQRVAPPPLRSAVRLLQDAHHHQQTLLDQMQQPQQQERASHMLLQQQLQGTLNQVGSHLPPASSITELGKPYPADSRHDFPTALSGNPNMSFTPSLPMLSPHLLSPLPALTPGDSTWANPMDAISQLPKPNPATSAPSSAMPPLLPLPTVSAGKAWLAKPAASNLGYGDVMPPNKATGPLMSLASAFTSHGLQQAAANLPPLLPTPAAPWFMPHTAAPSFHAVLPPWSPSPIPFSPGFFPPSPGPGPPPSLAAVPSAPAPNSANPAQIKFSASIFDHHPTMPKGFNF